MRTRCVGLPPPSRVMAEDAGERRVRRPPPYATVPRGLADTVKVVQQFQREIRLGRRIEKHAAELLARSTSLPTLPSCSASVNVCHRPLASEG